MTKIGLIGMEFHSFHGYYTEEQSVGNSYLIDVTIQFPIAPSEMNDSLNKTVNYESIYQICKEEMDVPRHLIETVADDILKQIVQLAPIQSVVSLNLRKKNPLLGGLVKHAMVELTATS
ncbi:MAG: dihydroneopterin aldolase [Saprospiraceae bacterium]|nr:dihydroneopterin aldolase [Saprospiraceae bacterium]